MQLSLLVTLLLSLGVACSHDIPASYADTCSHSYSRRHLPRSDDVLRPLTWGQLNILHTTDIHGWYAGHTKSSPPEPNYSGDWGDWAAFASRMRAKAKAEGRDLILVDTGDLHDGNGLSDGFPLDSAVPIDGHVSNQIHSLVDYDLLTVGNHELYNYTVARDVYDNFIPHWEGRYLTSNVKIRLPDQRNITVPMGELAATFITPLQGLRVTSFGVLFDFRLAADGILVQPPAEMVKEPWFAAALDQAARNGVDVFVVLGHMPVSGDPGWKAVHGAIRARFPSTPIAMLGGHTHVRDCRMFDDAAMALESGRYLETVGFMSLNLTQGQGQWGGKPAFARRYIDTNARNYAFHAGLGSVAELSTPLAQMIQHIMDNVASAWRLTLLHGVSMRDYFLDRVPYGDPGSLLSLLAEQVLPRVVRPSHPSSRRSLILINSGSQRFDLFAGPFTRNDQYIVSPFKDNFLHIPDVPWHMARRILPALLERKAQSTPPYSSGFIDNIFNAWLSTQARDTQSRKKAREAQAATHANSANPHPHPPPSLGYKTIDECGPDPDDTVHSPLPFSMGQPEYVASLPDPAPVDQNEPVHVVFVDFLLKPILQVLNSIDPQRKYETNDAFTWGNITTQLLYPRYAELAWQPTQGVSGAIAELEAQAQANGYPSRDGGASLVLQQ